MAWKQKKNMSRETVTPRMRRVSRNFSVDTSSALASNVTPRMRRVSRNFLKEGKIMAALGHASHEACE